MTAIFAISGSLRRASVNSAVLRAAVALAPPNVAITVYGGLGDLPIFNPDLENVEFPAVQSFRAGLRASDGLIIASPEYAHGVTGVIKNALDWIVGSGELEGKPVALLNVSIRAVHAYEALAETLRTMGAQIIPNASLVVPLPTNTMDESAILNDPRYSDPIERAVAVLQEAIGPRTVVDGSGGAEPNPGFSRAEAAIR